MQQIYMRTHMQKMISKKLPINFEKNSLFEKHQRGATSEYTTLVCWNKHNWFQEDTKQYIMNKTSLGIIHLVRK